MQNAINNMSRSQIEVSSEWIGVRGPPPPNCLTCQCLKFTLEKYKQLETICTFNNRGALKNISLE